MKMERDDVDTRYADDDEMITRAYAPRDVTGRASVTPALMANSAKKRAMLPDERRRDEERHEDAAPMSRAMRYADITRG